MTPNDVIPYFDPFKPKDPTAQTFTREQLEAMADYIDHWYRNYPTSSQERRSAAMLRAGADAIEERDRLKARWEPSAEMKARMLGEFDVACYESTNNAPHGIPWTTIKDIVATWHKHAIDLETRTRGHASCGSSAGLADGAPAAARKKGEVDGDCD